MNSRKENRGGHTVLNMQRLLPSWQVNLLLFGLLTVLVLGAFFWQLGKVNNSFRDHSLEHSRMVAGVIQENLQNALFSQETVEEIVRTFLGNTGRFVVYLNQVEPFTSDELTAFAAEAGLAGITIYHGPNYVVAGPQSWFPLSPEDIEPDGWIHRLRDRHLIFMPLPLLANSAENSIVIVGFDASRIDNLQDKTGLKALLKSLSDLPGINYIRLNQQNTFQGNQRTTVELLTIQDDLIAETRIPLDIGLLTVGLDARQLTLHVSSLRRQFFLFGALLIVLGLFFSWLLYRYQASDLQRTRNFERMMARQQESAALGRATATIAHEIRNPLNAIYMGLQRLTLESTNLDTEQTELIASMGEAVQRTSKIVNELQRFTKLISPQFKPVRLDLLLEQTITLYDPVCKKQHIEIKKDIRFHETVSGDKDLLAEVLSNLLKNGLEAQPDTGFIYIRLDKNKSKIELTISNGGFTLTSSEIKRLGKPYFTTKTRGTGLGLALSRRIIEAHNGQLLISPDQENSTLTITIQLPL